MDYDVYLDKKIVFEHLTEEEAKKKQLEFRQLIMAGVKTCYNVEDVKVLEHTVWFCLMDVPILTVMSYKEQIVTMIIE